MNVRETIRQVEAMRDSTEVEQLSTYVGRVSSEHLTDEEREQLGLTDDESIGYERAGQLPVERLRELFEADDWGDAWEGLDREQTEYYEADEGRIEAYNAVLSLLHGDPPTQDQVCECGHWFGEHNDIATRCLTGDCTCKGFRFDREASSPPAIADRGGDPEKWPEHVKRYFAEQEERYRVTGWFDGAGDCEPPEPGKTWLTIEYPDGEEMATIVQRTDTSLTPEVQAELRQQKEAAAEMIVEALNEHARPREESTMTDSEQFDPLNALSLARTALTDPHGLPDSVHGDDVMDADTAVEYAVDRIDAVMASLYFEVGAQEDDGAQAARVLTTLGRLLAALREEVEVADGSTDDACVMMAEAGDRIDEAIEALT